MIDYGRLKAAGNVILDNPVEVDGILDSIDITFNRYDEFSGVATPVTQTIKRQHIVNHKANLNAEKEKLTSRAATVALLESDAQEFINDAIAVWQA
jgi:hypothetical protein